MKTVFTVLTSACLLWAQPLLAEEPLKPAAWVPLPAVGSSPETGFQYGAYVMRIFPQTQVGTPQNRLEVLLQGTTNGQFQAFIWPNIYLQDGKLQFKGKLGGKYWPSGYFGNGNETADNPDKYADTSLEGSATLNYRLQPTLAVGAKLFAENHNLQDITEDPTSVLLGTGTIDEITGLYSGTGLNVIYDTRNNLDWPAEGQLLTADVDLFTSVLGSRADFAITTLRAARFWPVGDDVFGVSADIRAASSDTPFIYLPKPSGGSTLRGANGNRWTDNVGAGLQTEYRMTLSPRWAVVGFADSYQVAAELNELGLTDFHTSVGAGVRFGMTPDRFNIRLDLGWVDFESVGFTITVGEAF